MFFIMRHKLQLEAQMQNPQPTVAVNVEAINLSSTELHITPAQAMIWLYSNSLVLIVWVSHCAAQTLVTLFVLPRLLIPLLMIRGQVD